MSIENLSPAQDVYHTTLSLRALGIAIEQTDKETLVRSAEGLSPPPRNLDAGNSGTTMRLLAGLLAGQRFTATITGDASLQRRPMQRVIAPLTRMGAKIESNKGFAPLTITGRRLRGIDYALPVASSQVKSAILLAGLQAQGTTTVIEPHPTRDHTERMLRYLEVSLEKANGTVSVSGETRPKAKPISVPGDISSAAFFIVAAALVPDTQLTVRDVGINTTRTGIVDVLRKMGAHISVENEREVTGEPQGDLLIKYSELHAVQVGGTLIPRLIDELPILAICATQAHGVTVVQDAHELRVKETDRLRAVAVNLRRMGAQLEERQNGWVIPGPQRLYGAVLESFGDHRIAMAFSIAGLIAQGATVIEGAEWVDISYPGFYDDLESIIQL
jgi:3-phosphoshikimate 1-carboxyvinyltransferase